MATFYIDRVSQLRPAGVQLVNEGADTVKKCLVHEVTEDEVQPFVCKTGPLDYRLPPRKTKIYQGFLTGVRECLQPEADWGQTNVLTREFQDTIYASYWRKPLGRVADQAPMIPKGMIPENVTFGKPTLKGITAGELVSPPKSYLDVMEENGVAHDMYVKSHHDYNPGEQVNRAYGTPFKQNLVWGKTTPFDPFWIKKVLATPEDDKILVSKVLADHRKRTKPVIGKVLAPNNNIECVPEGHAFGRLNRRQVFGAGELLKDCEPDLNVIDLYEEMSHMNNLRQSIAKRQPTFPHRDLIDAFHQIDSGNTHCIPNEHAFETLAKFQIYPDKSLFVSLLRRLKLMNKDDMVAYEKMADLLNINAEFPEISKIEDCPKDLLNFETTNQIAYKYHCSQESIKTEDIPKAGKPPSRPYIPMEAVVSPNIFSNFGLEPKEFFVSRSPEYIRILFENLGCRLDNENFTKVWNSAQDGNGCVCVWNFFVALKSCQ